jgi:hypothetical protein
MNSVNRKGPQRHGDEVVAGPGVSGTAALDGAHIPEGMFTDEVLGFAGYRPANILAFLAGLAYTAATAIGDRPKIPSTCRDTSGAVLNPMLPATHGPPIPAPGATMERMASTP